MGLYKKLKKELNEIDVCRFCKKEALDFTKHIGYGEKEGVVYHYKAHCLNCGKTYYVKRCQEVYERVAHKNWIRSKVFKNKFE